MTTGIVLGIIAVAITAAVVGLNIGYTKGQEESCDRWMAYLSDKEDEIARLQRELKDALAAMRILKERREGGHGKD